MRFTVDVVVLGFVEDTDKDVLVVESFVVTEGFILITFSFLFFIFAFDFFSKTFFISFVIVTFFKEDTIGV